MIIKLLVEFLQVVQGGPPVFICFVCLGSWQLHSEAQVMVSRVPQKGGTSANVSLVCFWEILEAKDI